MWAIQALWGFHFIKESFNFIISGYTAHWYYGELKNISILTPYGILLTKHLGSVIACAFMTGFFNTFDTLFDIVRGFGFHTNIAFNWCSNFFDLVRSDAMAHINIWGNPYCNSARYCEYLCSKSLAL